MMTPVQVWPLSVVIVGTYRVEITPFCEPHVWPFPKKTCHYSIYNDRFGVHLVVIHTFCAMFLWGTPAESWQHGAGAVQQNERPWGGWELMIVDDWQVESAEEKCGLFCLGYDLKPQKNGSNESKKTKKTSVQGVDFAKIINIKCLFHVIYLGQW